MSAVPSVSFPPVLRLQSSRASLMSLALALLCAQVGASPHPAMDEMKDDVDRQNVSLEEAAMVPLEDERSGVQDTVFDRVTVVGGAERAARVPGSAHVITAEQLAHQQHTDIHRILRQVPGVLVQEEDGYGLRPNIGMRGTGVERSQKVTLLEDGIPIAPAPYAAPAAYYSPTAARMSSIEVRKGSAAIRQGPQTIGGVVNYLSTPIPGLFEGKLRVAAGTDDARQLQALYGGSSERWGFLVEAHRRETDGFKQLDGGGSTGFLLEDVVAKLRWTRAADARVPQQLELKLGRTEQDGDETYLGLTREDFDVTPFRRYLGSAADRIDARHDHTSLRWFVQPSARVDLTTTVYRNEFFRDWFKNEKTLGVGNGSILATPDLYGTELALLRGEIDGPDDAFALRHNRRDYSSQGIETVLGWRVDTGTLGGVAVQHQIEAGVRWHEDEEDRFQEEDGYTVRGGELVRTSTGVPGSNANRVGEAEALAFFVRDEITLGRWVVAPGVRWEGVETRRLDYGRADPERAGDDLSIRRNTIDALMPGLGVSFAPNDRWTVFGGVHRGFAPPGPSSGENVEPEENLAWELGVRHRDAAGSSFELVGFFDDYSNLLGADTVSGGGTGSGEQFNGGEVDVWGLEAAASRVLWSGRGLRLPARASYTYTHAEFRSSFTTGFADWAPAVEVGDDLPYLPEHQLWAEIGLEADRWSTYLSASWLDDLRTSAGAGPVSDDERIPSHLVFDASVQLEVRDSLRLDLRVRNLTDEVYLVARRPYGLRPGLSRTVLAGVSFTF